MIFNSIEFAIFFALVFAIYLLLRHTHRWQTNFLLLASCIFYGWWDWRFLFLISFTIIVDYSIGRLLSKTEEDRKRKRLVMFSVVSNLSVLCFFKYFNFFQNSFTNVSEALGFSPGYITLEIVLPVGISFYIFQSMSYIIDVYRKQLKHAEHLLDYATYVSLFPQLVAGPIERGTHLLPQIINPRTVKLNQVYEGGYLIIWGLFKKVFIADNLAQIVDPAFSSGGPYSGAVVIMATYAFAIQIYCDFSAYSDIARGVGKCLGFDLLVNFNLPYFATNPSEFWKRWHISLSRWLRDYLYIPLGGNRGSKWATNRNLAITMVLGGLWHGAQWNFILWGAYQGALLIAHRVLTGNRRAGKISTERPIVRTILKAIKIAVFFQFICFGWLLFRAESFAQINAMTKSLFDGIDLQTMVGMLPKILFYSLPLIIVQCIQFYKQDLMILYKAPMIVRSGLYVAFVYAIVVFGELSANEFIYFQF